MFEVKNVLSCFNKSLNYLTSIVKPYKSSSIFSSFWDGSNYVEIVKKVGLCSLSPPKNNPKRIWVSGRLNNGELSNGALGTWLVSDGPVS